MKPMRHDSLGAPSDIGISIGARAFNTMVDRYQAIIDGDRNLHDGHSGSGPTEEDYVAMVRIWNTIVFSRMGTSDTKLARFVSSLLPAHADRISHALGAKPTKGMALYSKQHDLYIGGKPHANSQYRLIVEP
jgi:hypothetical protein